jgi:hypothetical protein
VPQIPWQWLDKCSRKKAWTVPRKTKLTETKKGERDEEQNKENAHNFLWNEGDCSQRICPGSPNSQFHILLWRFMAIVWECTKTYLRTLATKGLAVASR